MKRLVVKPKCYKKSVAKGLRMEQDLYDRVMEFVKENNSNFNYVVNQMIEYGLKHKKNIK